MPSRHRSRERALQVLFQADIRQQRPDEAIAAFYDSLYTAEDEPATLPDPFMEELVRGAIEAMSGIDEKIAGQSDHWRMVRMPIVDRNILRLAVYEFLHASDVPDRVAIDEAIELAKAYGGEDSGRFVNGVLDRIRAAAAR